MTPPRILIIAGSDSGGGAGIQADIKTVTMLGGFAMTAITALTAQNTLGVDAASIVDTDMVLAQVDSVLADLGADAVKIGMIGSADTALAVAGRLERLPGIPVVFDPVMIATSGAELADAATISAFDRLAKRATIVTPNAPELAALTGRPVTTEAEALAAAREHAGRHDTLVLAKGGHIDGDQVTDILVGPEGERARWTADRIRTRAGHGTGCTLASAIAAHLGRGRSPEESIDRARMFVRTALLAAPAFGKGHGPIGHQAGDGGAGEMNLNQVKVPARDYEASVKFYRSLGLRQVVDSPGHYARFLCPGGATLSIHVEPKPRAGDAVIGFETADLDAAVERLEEAGLVFESLPADQPWLWREAHLRDPAGNRIMLFRAGENRVFPPWRVG